MVIFTIKKTRRKAIDPISGSLVVLPESNRNSRCGIRTRKKQQSVKIVKSQPRSLHDNELKHSESRRRVQLSLGVDLQGMHVTHSIIAAMNVSGYDAIIAIINDVCRFGFFLLLTGARGDKR